MGREIRYSIEFYLIKSDMQYEIDKVGSVPRANVEIFLLTRLAL